MLIERKVVKMFLHLNLLSENGKDQNNYVVLFFEYYSQILKLPLQARQVMLFSLITNDQNISELLNISLENIRTIRYRTKKQLKEKAKKEFPFTNLFHII